MNVVSFNSACHPLASRIENAWQAKVNLDYESCLRQLSEIKQELRIPGGVLTAVTIASLMSGTDASAVIDVLLLSASVYRALGDRARGDQLLAAVESALAASQCAPSFRFHYEKGMGAYIQGDFHLALEEFLRASLFADSELHKLWALGNALLSMENLGLPFERTYSQVVELMDRLRAAHDIERVERQIHAFTLRGAFRAGELRRVFQSDEARGESYLDQRRAFTHWVRLLPYHAFHRPLLTVEIDAYSSERSLLHCPFFRLRTLQGVLHPEDARGAPPLQWTDRLYLWVWLWLQDPDSFPVERILILLKQADISDLTHRLTVEDSRLARNALSWLGLFDGHCARQLKAILSRLQLPRAAKQYPLLQLENHVTQYFQALRQGDRLMAADFRASLESDPLWRSPDLYFRELVEAVADERTQAPSALRSLVPHLRQVIAGRDVERVSSEARFVVDLVHHQILDRQTRQKLVSEAACRALHLLRSGEPVDCEQFVQVCFGLREFDPVIHNGKIFNLLSRIKSLIGAAPAFRMKSGRILPHGSWSDFDFREHGMRVSLAGVLAEWERQWSGTPTPATITVQRRATFSSPREWDWGAGLTRSDIERLKGTPRSTTNRLIAKWVRQGLVEPRGRARSTRYFLSIGNTNERELS